MTVTPPPTVGNQPDISLVMPAYNEEDIVGYTIRRLALACARENHTLQLIAVDNGSWDRTGEIIKSCAAQFPGVVYHRVDKNRGYGYGVLAGLPLCTAPWIGIVPADGQVDAEDVIRLYEAALMTGIPVVAKARRRFRMDGLTRKFVTTAFNTSVRILWPGLTSFDVNGTPKILPRTIANAMNLQSEGWSLDAEIMIKAHYMGMRILEFNVMARERGSGLSHVRLRTCWELFESLIRYRFSRKLALWRQTLAPAGSHSLGTS